MRCASRRRKDKCLPTKRRTRGEHTIKIIIFRRSAAWESDLLVRPVPTNTSGVVMREIETRCRAARRAAAGARYREATGIASRGIGRGGRRARIFIACHSLMLPLCVTRPGTERPLTATNYLLRKTVLGWREARVARLIIIICTPSLPVVDIAEPSPRCLVSLAGASLRTVCRTFRGRETDGRMMTDDESGVYVRSIRRKNNDL